MKWGSFFKVHCLIHLFVSFCNCEMWVIFQGSLFDPSFCIVLIDEVVELLDERCKAFTANLVEFEFKPKDLFMIHVIVEFFDVFLDKHPRLPPKRAVEFVISKAPYHMALVEFKRVKESTR